MTSVGVRPLTEADLLDAWQLGRTTFGGPADPPPLALRPVPGWTRWGAFDERGRLVGKATDLGHEQWWGGRRVPTADVGGVVVAPEARGAGVGRALLRTLLEQAHERGAAVSALHPTVSAVYRSMGWELAGVLASAELDTASLPRRLPPGLTVRAAGPHEGAVVRAVYEQVARGRDGLLTRTGGAFDEPSVVDGTTLVEEEGAVTGALGWSRAGGYGVEGRITARDLLATTPQAARALAAVLGGWTTVAHTVRVPLLDGDPFAALLPVERSRATRPDPWMHRPVDVQRAVSGRGWPPHVRGRVAFRLRDDAAPWNAGNWELTVEDGAGELRRAAGPPDLWLDVRGFAVLYCAATTGRAAAQAGLAGGGADPAALDVLASGSRAALLDYF